jgi:hypothetical protein
MEPLTTNPQSIQLGGGAVFLVAAIVFLIAGVPLAAAGLAVVAALMFWLGTRARSTPTA